MATFAGFPGKLCRIEYSKVAAAAVRLPRADQEPTPTKPSQGMLMTRLRLVLVLALMALVLPLVVAPAPAGDETVRQDEQLLRQYHGAPDAPSLLNFFRQRAPTDKDLEELRELIGKLNHRLFAVRDRAAKALLARGPSALALLKETRD